MRSPFCQTTRAIAPTPLPGVMGASAREVNDR